MTKVCVNMDNEYILCNFEDVCSSELPVLRLQTSDFTEVKNVFSNIDLIEIYQGNNKIAEYNIYDTYSYIAYIGQIFFQDDNMFHDCIEVQLKKASLEEQVNRIEKAIKLNVDTDNMSVDEYRDFIFKQISDDCTQDIYLGTEIEINGTQQNFSFKSEDQINLLQLYLLTKMYPSITAVPYHADGNTCMFYTASQIQTIYMTLIIRLMTITTYYNQLNLYAKTLTTKEELSQLRYGMELPEQYASVVSTIVNETVSALEGIASEEGNSNEVGD